VGFFRSKTICSEQYGFVFTSLPVTVMGMLIRSFAGTCEHRDGEVVAGYRKSPIERRCCLPRSSILAITEATGRQPHPSRQGEPERRGPLHCPLPIGLYACFYHGQLSVHLTCMHAYMLSELMDTISDDGHVRTACRR
jgi:hypothetical protein